MINLVNYSLNRLTQKILAMAMGFYCFYLLGESNHLVYIDGGIDNDTVLKHQQLNILAAHSPD